MDLFKPLLFLLPIAHLGVAIEMKDVIVKATENLERAIGNENGEVITSKVWKGMKKTSPR